MKITMARGDVYVVPFGVYINCEQTHDQMDNIYFTVKKHHYDHDYIFQKRLSDGSISTDGEGGYILTIDPEDTNQLSLGMYEFDFEIVKLPEIKKTFAGEFELTREVTHYYNEET